MESPAPLPSRDRMFGAFTAPQQKRRYWPWILGITALFAGVVAIAAQRDPSAFNLVTPRGIKTVRLEMTTSQVQSMLGHPIARVGAEDCFHYGWPKMEADFDVYRVCFDNGRVREVKTERFEVRRILAEDEEMPPEPKPRRLEDIEIWKPAPGPNAPAASEAPAASGSSDSR